MKITLLLMVVLALVGCESEPGMAELKAENERLRAQLNQANSVIDAAEARATDAYQAYRAYLDYRDKQAEYTAACVFLIPLCDQPEETLVVVNGPRFWGLVAFKLLILGVVLVLLVGFGYWLYLRRLQPKAVEVNAACEVVNEVQERKKQLLKDIEKLEFKLKKLVKKHSKMFADNEILEQKNASLRRDNEVLQEANEALKAFD